MTPGSSRDAIQASKLKAKPVTWLWKNRIPRGMITLVAGRPDQGKGLLAVHVAADVSKRKMNVLYSAMEDDPAMMTKPRLEAAGANLDRVLLWRFMLPMQLKQLESRIERHDIRLVVIDPMAAHVGGGISKSSDSIRLLTNPLTEIAEHTGCSFLIIDHALKRVPKHANPLSAVSGGSSGLPSVARMAYMFGVDPKDTDRRVLAPIKSNLVERPQALSFELDVAELDDVGTVPYLLGGDEMTFDPSMLLHGDPDLTRPGRPPDKRAAAGEWLAKYLYKRPKYTAKASLIYEDGKQFALSGKVLRGAALDLEIIKEPEGGGRNCTWRLPDSIVKAMKIAEKAQKKGGK